MPYTVLTIGDTKYINNERFAIEKPIRHDVSETLHYISTTIEYINIAWQYKSNRKKLNKPCSSEIIARTWKSWRCGESYPTKGSQLLWLLE